MKQFVINDYETGPIGIISIRDRNGTPEKIKETAIKAIESFHDCTVTSLTIDRENVYKYECDSDFIDNGTIELVPTDNYTI